MTEATELNGLFDVSGKRALVTGATSGIGKLISEGLAAAGVEVWTAARTPLPNATERDIAADVTTNEGMATIKAALGDRPLHILVNNAGKNVDTPLEGNGRDGFSEVLGLNLTAPFVVMQAVLSNLEQAASSNDPARVINITSVAALDPGGLPNYSYGASKAGLAMMPRHAARHLAKRNITCNAIAPGLFPSRMSEQFMNFKAGDPPPPGWASPLGGRTGELKDIAGAVIYLCSRAGAWITGIQLPVSGGAATIKSS